LNKVQQHKGAQTMELNLQILYVIVAVNPARSVRFAGKAGGCSVGIKVGEV